MYVPSFRELINNPQLQSDFVIPTPVPTQIPIVDQSPKWFELGKQIDLLKESMTNTKESIDKITQYVDNTIYYITHPIEVIKISWDFITTISPHICLLLCMIGLVLYVIEIKKFKRMAMISFMIFVVIQAINAGLNA
jgi:hypothetical protein